MKMRFKLMSLVLFFFLNVFVAQAVDADNNIIVNGDFEKGVGNWEFWSYGCSVNSIVETGQPVYCGNAPVRREILLMRDIAQHAPSSESSKSMKIIVQGDKNDVGWKTHLQTSAQPGHAFVMPDGPMKLEFWVKSSVAFDSSVTITQTAAPYTSLGLYKEIRIGNEWQYYSFVFNATANQSAVFILNLGNCPDFTQLHIDEVKLYPVDKTELKAKLLVVEKKIDAVKVEPEKNDKGVNKGSEKKIHKIDNKPKEISDVVVKIKKSRIKITKIVKEIKEIKGQQKAVFYIVGKNFTAKGDVKVGNAWAAIHYRRDDFIIAVAPPSEINGTVFVTRK